jgi:hypothetical protein
MLSCMDQVLQKRFEQLSTVKIVEALKVLYHKEHAKVHEMTKAMDECKIAEVREQGLRLADYYDSITTMEIDFPKAPENDLILTLLHEAMLKPNKIGMQNQQKLLVNKIESFKKKCNTKRNKGGASCETICFYYREKGLWKRNCLKYLADKKNSSSGKGIKVIQVNFIDILLAEKFKSWVFNTGSVAHIRNTMQGPWKIHKLRRNEVVMHVGNGDGLAAQAIGVMTLCLPSGFILHLNNCYFILKLCNNIISRSCLIIGGYSYKS